MATATAKKAKKGGGFFVQEWDWKESGIRAGKAVARGGSYIGINALANSSMISGKKIAKYMGPLAIVVGLGMEMTVNNDNGAARIAGGIGEGLTLWGMQRTTGQLLGPDNAPKWGLQSLNGLGAVDDQPRDDSGVNWNDLADQAEAAALSDGDQTPNASAASMAGLNETDSSILY